MALPELRLLDVWSDDKLADELQRRYEGAVAQGASHLRVTVSRGTHRWNRTVLIENAAGSIHGAALYLAGKLYVLGPNGLRKVALQPFGMKRVVTGKSLVDQLVHRVRIALETAPLTD